VYSRNTVHPTGVLETAEGEKYCLRKRRESTGKMQKSSKLSTNWWRVIDVIQITRRELIAAQVTIPKRSCETPHGGDCAARFLQIRHLKYECYLGETKVARSLLAKNSSRGCFREVWIIKGWAYLFTLRDKQPREGGSVRDDRAKVRLLKGVRSHNLWRWEEKENEKNRRCRSGGRKPRRETIYNLRGQKKKQLVHL